jgi:uncharacterized protein (TIGR02284 family)
MEQSSIISTLNTLIDTCKDGEMGFRTSAEHVPLPELRTLLCSMADRCTESAGELSVLVRHLGGDPDERGSLAGALHRGLIDLKAMLGSADVHAILEECERGEDAAKQRFRDALGRDLPPNVRIVIDRQYQGVVANHDRIKALRDTLPSAP